MSLPYILLTIAIIIVLSIGTIGIVDPKIPDIPLLWLGIFLFALLTNFSIIDVPLILFFTAAGLSVTLIESILRRKSLFPQPYRTRTGLTMITALISGIIGSLISFPIGLFLGVIWGASFGVLSFGSDVLFQYETASYRVIGFVGTTILKISVAILMIGIFFQKIILSL